MTSLLNIEQFRPMLSASLPCTKGKDAVPTEEEVIKDLKRLNWYAGFLCSPKIDGIRAIKHPTMGLVSRTLTPIPNKYIQAMLEGEEWDYLDGELIVNDQSTFNENQSAIMSQGGRPEFIFNVFDHIKQHNVQFVERCKTAQNTVDGLVTPDGIQRVKHVQHVLVSNIEELLDFEASCVALGYEGIIIRHPHAGYKNNRSTFKQMGMIKIKRFIDCEAQIIGFEELLRNTNEATIDARGYTKRSSHNDGYIPAGTLGKFVATVVNGPFTGAEVRIGSGLDDSLRDTIWRDRESYLGKYVKFKYQPHGSKDAPRSPIFLGFRDARDM